MRARDSKSPPANPTVEPLAQEKDGSHPFLIRLPNSEEVILPPRQDSYSALKNRDRSREKIVVLPIQSGLDTSAEGAMRGPDEFMKSGIEEFLREKVGFGSVELAGSIIEQHFCGPDQRDLSRSDRLFRQIASFAAEGAERMLSYLKEGKTVLSIGGDHSMSFASLKAFSKFCHDNNLKGAVVHIDAHGDINYLRPENDYQPDEGESGNPHGMVLRAAFDRVYPSIDAIYTEARLEWQNYLGIGHRSLDPKELETIREKKLKVHTREGFDLDRVKISIRELRERVDVIMVSFDIDVADMSFAPATEMQNNDGLSLDQINRIAVSLGEDGAGLAPVIAVDVAELYPRDGKVHDTSQTIQMVKGFLERVFGISNSEYVDHLAREVDVRPDEDAPSTKKMHDHNDLINQVLANKIFREWDAKHSALKIERQKQGNPWLKKGSVMASLAASLVTLGFFLGRESNEVPRVDEDQRLASAAPLDPTNKIAGQEARATEVTQSASSPTSTPHRAPWGVHPESYIKDQTAIGWTDSPFDGRWDYIHQQRAKDQFEFVKDLLVNELGRDSAELVNLFKKEDQGFYHPTLGRANDQDNYMHNLWISSAMSQVTLALLRTGPERRAELLEETLVNVFKGNEEAKIAFTEKLNAFTFNVNSKGELLESLEARGLLSKS